jgi:hypothetical protein
MRFASASINSRSSSTSSSSRSARRSRSLVLVCLLTAGCASTRVAFVGGVESADAQDQGHARLLTSLEGTLSVSRVFERAKVELDPHFSDVGFQGVKHPLVVTRGDETVLMLSDDADKPNASLYVAMAPGELAPNKVFGDGEFIPYLDLHLNVLGSDDEPHIFGAVCKGGRGRVTIEAYSPNEIKGNVALAVSCRTYIDGYEREEEDLRLEGPFKAKR